MLTPERCPWLQAQLASHKGLNLCPELALTPDLAPDPRMASNGSLTELLADRVRSSSQASAYRAV